MIRRPPRPTRTDTLCPNTTLFRSDLDLDSGLVTVLGKGNKQRSVPVGSHARAALEAWRGETKAANDAPVFPGRAGAPISQRAVQIRIRQLAQDRKSTRLNSSH